MKTTRIFAAAIALLSVLSCQKEEQQTINNSEIEGANLITCTFAANDAATKTTLEGMTPKWAAGDTVVLYNSSNDTLHLTLAARGTASSRTGIIDGTDATKFTFVRPEGWTDVYAIYPSVACVNSYPLPKLKFSEQDGTFGKANICVAAEISGTMSFKNVGAILKFPSKPAKVTKITIAALGSVNKNYKISFDGATPSLTPVGSTFLPTTYSIGEGTDAIYIGVPSCTIPEESVFTYKTSADATLGTYTTGAANTVEVNKVYNLGAMMGTLPGLFSIDEKGNKVQFSQGNLYCNTIAADGSYAFEAYQYDYRHYNGKTNDAAVIVGSSTTTPENTVGSFFWSKDASVAYASTYSDASTATTDKFFTNDQTTETNPNSSFTVNGSTGLWRTLTRAEWTYLLNSRTGVAVGTKTDARYAEVKVNSVCGMLIFPDTFTWPEGITTSKPGTFNDKEFNWNSVDYTAAEFVLLESAGCVFLPAAGSRYGSGVYNVGSFGDYWSSTPYGAGSAYILYFGSVGVSPADVLDRYNGYSVRLVCDTQ